jgi:fatty-acyl-CoA synthase
MTDLHVEAAAVRWPEAVVGQPGLTLEEIVRPFGVPTSVSFLDVDGNRSSVTYDQLARRIAGAAIRLREHGVGHGALVAMTIGNDLGSVVAALAVWAAGATLVSLPPPPRRGGDWYAGSFGRVLAAMGCRFLVVDPAGAAGPAPATPEMRRIPLDSLQGVEAVRLPDTPIPAVALVQFTSGSLGAPKGVAIARDTLAGHVKAIGHCFDYDPAEDVIATWLPLYHDLGFACFFMTSLYSRVTQVHAAPRSFVLNPAVWLELLAAERATVSGGPGFAYRLAARVPYPGGLDLSRMRICLNAAERIHWQDVLDFQRAAEPLGWTWETMHPAYGLAEGTVGVTAMLYRHGPVRGPGGLASSGHLLPGAELATAGAEPSTLHLGGAWLFDGYYTERGFEPRAGSWFDTEDVGFLHDGQVYVLGRQAEVISAAGRNVFAEDVEEAALQAARPFAHACAAFKPERSHDRFGLALEVSVRELPAADAGELGRAVRAAVSEALGTRVAPLVVVGPGAIPRTTSGKVRRAEFRDAYEAGEILARKVLAELS